MHYPRGFNSNQEKRQTTITLVRPPVFLNMNAHPLNIGYIYAMLSKEKYQRVFFVDGEKIATRYARKKDYANRDSNNQLWLEISNKILSSKPDVVAFSCYSVSITATQYIIQMLRDLHKYKGQIWAGGIHPTTCPSEMLSNIDGLDGVVVGEGEITFKAVCRAVHFREDISNIKGIAYRKGGKIKINEPRQLMQNMDELPLPSRTFSDNYTYNGHIIMTSRGCPFDCDFCDSKNIWTRCARFRSGEHVAKEIESIASLGVKSIGLRDDTFTLKKKHVENICKSIKNKNLTELKYSVGSRIDTIDDDMISLLKDMNVKTVTFGVETGSNVVQKRIRKNLDVSTVVPTVLKTNKAGIRTITFFMLGHPQETEAEINETCKLLRELSKYCSKRNFISINITCPYPGTGYWDYSVIKYGKPVDFYNESYKYYHQTKSCVNLTNMDDNLFSEYISRIRKFANIVNLRHKIYTAITDPTLLLSKARERICR